MRVTCTYGCGRVFDDAVRSTICPHPELIGPCAHPETEEGKQRQRELAEFVEAYMSSTATEKEKYAES